MFAGDCHLDLLFKTSTLIDPGLLFDYCRVLKNE